MENQCQHLTITQRTESLKLLQNSEHLFNRTLGTWETDPVDFGIKEDAKPIFLRTYNSPKVHEEVFKNKVERLVLNEYLRY